MFGLGKLLYSSCVYATAQNMLISSLSMNGTELLKEVSS